MNVDVPDYDVKQHLTIDPDDYILLIVDMQKDFAHPDGALYNPEAEETIPDIADFARFAHESGVPVWYTQDTHVEDSPEFEIWGEHCLHQSRGWEIVEDLQPHEEDMVFEKPRYDAFFGTDLEYHLRQSDRDGLIIAGTVANICVHYTAASAGLRFLDTVIPVDLISALTEFDYHATLRQASWLFQSELAESEDISFDG